MHRSESASGLSSMSEAQDQDILRRIAETACVAMPDKADFKDALTLLQARFGEDDELLTKTCDLLLSLRGGQG
ncbi:hypothetical protein [Desulfocurvibacter africanus]|uniref:hypothetical protein n=1 Tax=Desulfocurvibacter africanus TaxID=873 RepID=UPI00041A1F60|nr:hypothetical protein [Desulfocurvibacter africanus]